MMRRHLPAALCAAAVLALAGCSAGTDPGGRADPAPHPSTPPATGTGPYPEPARTAPAAPVPRGASGTPKAPAPAPGDIDRQDADAVARGALTAMWTSDTALDTSPQDAIARAARAGWCTPAYAAQLTSHTPRAAPGAQWAEWARHRAHTTVKAAATAEAGRPADTPTTAYRQYTLTITPHGRDNWSGTPVTVTVFAELTRTAAGQPWQLAATTAQ
ncbi:hypothetical protein [Streptomyces sp. NPDC018045]|uniref:hypothetical protein n=1 Tax=Streptomyces sp. NPDC018045 TaxID=3365037 RepID=UPI0037976168